MRLEYIVVGFILAVIVLIVAISLLSGAVPSISNLIDSLLKRA